MIITKADCKINGLHILEVSITSQPAPGYVPVAIASYVKIEERDLGDGRKSIATHGKCTTVPVDRQGVDWSENTRRLLEELLESMEQDLLPRHFNITEKEPMNEPSSAPDQEADQI
jgi:hypothetical protein